jgi:hypothetical protein
MCFFHMNERDLLSLAEYRKRTGEDYLSNSLAGVA